MNDQTALELSRKIMEIVNGTWQPGGAPQIQAKIQCLLIDVPQSIPSADVLTDAQAEQIFNRLGYRTRFSKYLGVYARAVQKFVLSNQGPKP